jgi:hypothetical protein
MATWNMQIFIFLPVVEKKPGKWKADGIATVDAY